MPPSVPNSAAPAGLGKFSDVPVPTARRYQVSVAGRLPVRCGWSCEFQSLQLFESRVTASAMIAAGTYVPPNAWPAPAL